MPEFLLFCVHEKLKDKKKVEQIMAAANGRDTGRMAINDEGENANSPGRLVYALKLWFWFKRRIRRI